MAVKFSVKINKPKFKVTFQFEDGSIYLEQLVKKGETAIRPEDPEAPEGYVFKNWLLDGEAFDFSTVITSDILLIAEFEEAGEEVIYENTLDFYGDENTGKAKDYNSSYEDLGIKEDAHYQLIVDGNPYNIDLVEMHLQKSEFEFIDALANSDIMSAGIKIAVSGDYDEEEESNYIEFTINTPPVIYEGSHSIAIKKVEAPAGETFIFDENSDAFEISSRADPDLGIVYTLETVKTLAQTITKPIEYMSVDIGDLHCEGVPTLSPAGGYSLSEEEDLSKFYFVGVYLLENSIALACETVTDLSNVTSAKVVITFGEAPVEDVVWEDDVLFTKNNDDSKVSVNPNISIELNENDYVVFTCGEEIIKGRFAFDNNMYTFGNSNYFNIAYNPEQKVITIYASQNGPVFDITTLYHAKLVHVDAPTVTSWTWDGIYNPETDIYALSDTQWLHKISDQIFTPQHLNDSGLKYTSNSIETSYVLKEVPDVSKLNERGFYSDYNDGFTITKDTGSENLISGVGTTEFFGNVVNLNGTYISGRGEGAASSYVSGFSIPEVVNITCLTYTPATFSCESKPFTIGTIVVFNIEGTEYEYTVTNVEDYNAGQKITLSGSYPWMFVGTTYTVKLIAPAPSGRVVFDGDILYTPKTDNTHRFVTTEVSTQDETYNKIRVGFYDVNRTIASDGEQLSTKIIVAEDASTISLTIDGVDYGTHTLSTTMMGEDDTEIQTSIVFDVEPAYVTGNGVLMSYGTFKNTGENYFVFIGYKPY